MGAHLVPATVARAVLKGAVTLAVRRVHARRKPSRIGDAVRLNKGAAGKAVRHLADGRVVAVARVALGPDGVIRVLEGQSARMFGKELDRRPGAINYYDPSQIGFQSARKAIQRLELAGYRDWADLAGKLVGRARRVTVEVIGWALD